MSGIGSTKKVLIALVQLVLWFSVICGFVWAVGAVYFLTFLPGWLSAGLAVLVPAIAVFLFRRQGDWRKFRQSLALIVVCVYGVHLLQRPSATRNWAADNAETAEVIIEGDRVAVSNFRNNVYRSATDYDARYEHFEFSLSHIDKAWFVMQRFTALEGIAHNFLTFRINDGKTSRYFSVSAEIRREEGESFSPVAGLYRQYELIYIVADERDQIGMRTIPRPDDRVFLYPVNATAAQIQQLFVDMAARINKLKDRPEFYHSLLNNCTNNIVLHTYKLTPDPINWLDPRIVAPGYADRVAFAWHLIGDQSQTFEQLQKKSRIDKVARQSGITDDFSLRIRSLVE